MQKLCTRKDFFRIGALKLTDWADSLYENCQTMVNNTLESHQSATPVPVQGLYLRPPGAKTELEFLEKCTQCDECIRVCPHWVIRKAGMELGRKIVGTPIILPKENPCLMCNEFPCVNACETGALSLDGLQTHISIGLAKVDENKCYMGLGQPCDYCMKNCPVNPKAIEVNERGQLPVVYSTRCTGCGICAQICPANALFIEDKRS